MRNIMTRCMVFLLIFGIAFSGPAQFFAQSPHARIIVVYRVDGIDAARSNDPLFARSSTLLADHRLSQGNYLRTGQDTQVYMALLDPYSIIKMDEQSRLSVASSGSHLTLNLTHGAALVRVDQPLPPGSSMNIRAGNVTTGLRGTMLIKCTARQGSVVVTMFSGHGVVQMPGADGRIVEVPLHAGQAMELPRADEQVFAGHVIRPLDVGQMSIFEMQETINNRDYLLQVGTVTPAMLTEAERLLPQRIEERDSARAPIQPPSAVPLARPMYTPMYTTPIKS